MDIVSLGCCLLAFLLYYNTLDAGFVYDDRRAILTNPDLLPTTSWMNLFRNDFWGTPLTDSGSHGSYRPLCVITFRLNHLLGGFQPWGYHLVNVLLHCLATALVVRVARKIFPTSCMPVGPTVAGLLFATHPIHTEAVAGIVGRADLAACNFYLLSFLAYIAHLKYRDQRCAPILQPNVKTPMVNNQHCACCDTHFSRVEKRSSRTKQQRPGKLITNNRSGNDSGMEDCNCGCILEGGQCGWRSFKQWSAFATCVVLAAAAMLSKETGITVLVVCGLYDLTTTSFAGIYKKQMRSLLIIGLALITMVVLRISVTWGNTPTFATADNPTAKNPSIITRFLTFSYLPIFNFRLLVFPVILSFDWSMDAIPRITSILDTRNSISLFFYLTLIRSFRNAYKKIYNKELNDRKSRRMIKTIRKRTNEQYFKNANCSCPLCHHSLLEHHSAICRTNNNNNHMNPHSVCICQPVFLSSSNAGMNLDPRQKTATTQMALLTALAFLTIPFIPATNMFFYVGFVVAERVLYLPSVGYCLLLGLGAARIRRMKVHLRGLAIALTVVLILFSVRTIRRNLDWHSEENLYAAAIPVNPPKAYGNLGTIFSGQGKVNEAEWAYKQALDHRGNMADVHYNLGNLLQGKHNYEEAIQSYQRAIHFRPSLALAYVNLGAALVSAGRCQEAVTVLRQGSRIDGSGLKDRRQHDSARISALLQLGALYAEQGRLQAAVDIYKEALITMPAYYPPQSIYNLLGETLSRLKQFDEAERMYQAALQAQPDHVPAHITYGKLLAKNGSRIAEAEQWFRRAQRLAPSDPSVYHHYGEFLASQGRHAEAAVHYVRAAELKTDDYELAVAAATALRQADRRDEAEKWYQRAVAMKPLDARGHTNLGAMLHLNGKYRQASDSYREALRLQPDDVTTLTNLHKLHSVMA